MTRDSNEGDRHILEQSAPAFLELLDTDPQRAWEEFHNFAWRLLRSYPPPAFRNCSREDQDEITAGIVRDCQADNFRMLRSYEDWGLPFAGWLGRIARNRALDLLRHSGRARVHSARAVTPASPNPGMELENRQLLAAVRECLGRIGDWCHLLLVLAALELKPAEIAALLRRPEESKKISDSLRGCRQRLKEMLRQRGHGPAFPGARESSA